MTPGEVRLKWDSRGALDIRTSMAMDADSKQLVINALLDAAKAINGHNALVITPGAAGGAILRAGGN